MVKETHSFQKSRYASSYHQEKGIITFRYCWGLGATQHTGAVESDQAEVWIRLLLNAPTGDNSLYTTSLYINLFPYAYLLFSTTMGICTTGKDSKLTCSLITFGAELNN